MTRPELLIKKMPKTVQVAALIIFGVAAVVWIYVESRVRFYRRRGVLTAVDSGASAVRKPASPVSSRPNEDEPVPATDADYVFGYSAIAYAAYSTDAEDDEGTAYRLAVQSGIAPTSGSSENLRIWRAFDFDDPESLKRFREQIPLGRLLLNLTVCLYCGHRLERGATDDLRMFGSWGKWAPFHHWRYHTAACRNCGWWCVTHDNEDTNSIIQDWNDYVHAYAMMRRFDAFALETPLALAREFLARNPHKLARFDPFRFEELLTDCLRDAFGDAEIVKLGGRADEGIDIKAIARGGETTLIQVKRRADFSKSEGVRAVRELHGVMLAEGVPRGMVITTAHDFSGQARAEVAKAGRHLEHYSMDLLPLADVKCLLGTPAPRADPPWEAHGIRLDVADPSWAGSDDWVDRSALPDHLQAQDWGLAWRF